jgi:hypothetical protein
MLSVEMNVRPLFALGDRAKIRQHAIDMPMELGIEAS